MALADDIRRLRRLTAEPTQTTYTDADLTEILGRCLTYDAEGRKPSTHGGVLLDTLYQTTYDVYRAAAEVWEEKAATVAPEFDYSGDGANLSLSQKHAQYMQQAASMRARANVAIVEPVRDGFQGLEGEAIYEAQTGTGNA